jgi:hypothetical protein
VVLTPFGLVFFAAFSSQDKALDASKGPASASFAGAAIRARVLGLSKEAIFAGAIL